MAHPQREAQRFNGIAPAPSREIAAVFREAKLPYEDCLKIPEIMGFPGGKSSETGEKHGFPKGKWVNLSGSW